MAKILRSSMCGGAGWEQASWCGGSPQPRPVLQFVFIDFSLLTSKPRALN